MTSSRHLKCLNCAVFVSESRFAASESVEPDLDVQDLVHADIHDMMDEHEGDECAACVLSLLCMYVCIYSNIWWW